MREVIRSAVRPVFCRHCQYGALDGSSQQSRPSVRSRVNSPGIDGAEGLVTSRTSMTQLSQADTPVCARMKQFGLEHCSWLST